MDMENREDLKKGLLRDEIKDKILDAILVQDLRPGDRIVETRWARELCVSQAPVREAIRELEVMGVAENKPFQGAFVRSLSQKDMRDAYGVRLALESLAVNDSVEKITEKELADMEKLLGDMIRFTEAGDIKAYLEKDIVFHEIMVAAAGNQMLLRMWRISKMTEWTYLTKRMENVDLTALAKGHEKITEALRARDKARAKEAVCEHIYGFISNINPVLDWDDEI